MGREYGGEYDGYGYANRPGQISVLHVAGQRKLYERWNVDGNLGELSEPVRESHQGDHRFGGSVIANTESCNSPIERPQMGGWGYGSAAAGYSKVGIQFRRIVKSTQLWGSIPATLAC